MVDGGRTRMTKMMQRNEEAGGATNNPYASAVFRRFVMPMATMIEAALANPAARRRKAHVSLLLPMDAQVVAYLAVRHTLNSLMSQGQETLDSKAIAAVIGKAVYNELLLSLFENIEPDLFHALVNDLDRRMSKNERYRMTVFKMQARKVGIEFPEWGINGAIQVGSFLLDLMVELGMIEVSKVRTRKHNKLQTKMPVRMTADLMELVSGIKDFLLDNCPVFLPCVEPPRDWIGVADGGWHTLEMRRAQPFAIKTFGSWSELSEYDLSTPLAAINALQKVQWQINRPILETIKQIAQYYDTEEIVGYAEPPKPERPYWLTPDMKKADMAEEELIEFKAWSRATAQWFTDQRIRGTKYGRINMALRVAERFEDYPELYFVYFADFRGRLYAQTSGVSPQGSDMQKALLRFAKGKPLSSTEAVHWFKIHGANKYGYDKVSLAERIAWVDERDDLIRRIGSDPLNTKDDWDGADYPLQFIAWCIEYKRWKDSPDTFLSHLPVSMDGSCNGLQNFSAMLRDEIGGKATNLVPSTKPNDIYQMVADVTSEKLRAISDKPIPEPDGSPETEKKRAHFANENRFRHMWLDHGISRSLVKRSVMTKPYGSTRFSCADYIVADYLRLGKAPEFARQDYGGAARYLSRFVWEAISEVVVKADEAMTWLQNCSRLILNKEDHICWVTPTGFPVIQRYSQVDMVRIRTRLCGSTKMMLAHETDTPDRARHKNGIAPNMVHSLDASHMALVALAGHSEGMSLAMIHDDFGAHAADAPRLAKLIRECFVAMYEAKDPLKELADRYDLPAPPKSGSLDLRQVCNSDYFFA